MNHHHPPPPPPPPPASPASSAAEGDGTGYPILLPRLRDALGCLYSLPRYTRSHGAAAVNPTLRTAHEREAHLYLLDFRGRNVRRKRQSALQSRRDAAASGSGGGDGGGNDDAFAERRRRSDEGATNRQRSGDHEYLGSAWLASVALLCLPDADHAERLFAAQTLLHRLRRLKMVEAFDVEIEDPEFADAGQPRAVGVSGDAARDQYADEAGRYHPLLRGMLGQYRASAAAVAAVEGSASDEERTKAELSLLTLAALLHLSASLGAEGFESDANISPVLSTLGSAMAVAALRFKFCASNSGVAYAPSVPTLVGIVTHSASAAAEAAAVEATASGRDPAPHAAIGSRVACTCLGAVPDAILGSPGGARGRLSVDPRWVQLASSELRDVGCGVGPFRDALVASLSAAGVGGGKGGEARGEDEERAHTRVLQACERWAKFVPLPLDFVEGTVPLAGRYLSRPPLSPARSASYAYLIALFDGATLNMEQVLAMTVGLSPDSADASHQLGRKKMSSKAKKRHRERLSAAVNENDAADVRRRAAEEELGTRGDTACRAAALAWGEMRAAAVVALSGEEGGGDFVAASDGEGPVGCLGSCASACLPHLLRRSGASAAAQSEEYVAFFGSVMEVLLMVCRHSDKSARALSYGPLLAVHAALAAPGCRGTTLERIAVDSIYECVMALAATCGYPPGYFDDLSLDNDEDLENERDDVRNVLRSVTDLESLDAVSLATMESCASVRILERVLHACADAVEVKDVSAGGPLLLPHETVVHALSALAKPLNRLAEIVATLGDGCGVPLIELLTLALRLLSDVSTSLLRVFDSPSAAESLKTGTFTVSRLTCLATTSYAPLFSSIAVASESGSLRNSGLQYEFRRALGLLIRSSVASAAAIPELAFESTLEHTMFDIRGAMRGPGGEDHVGCISVSRLSLESDCLARTMLLLPLSPRDSAREGAPENSLLSELCRLHDDLKMLELSRGPGVDHGRGVAPKSRRVVLSTLSRLSLVALNLDCEQAGILAENVSAKLREMFQVPLDVAVRTAKVPKMASAEKFYRMCETAFDLASFSSTVASSLFSVESHTQAPVLREGAQSIVDSVVAGYSLLLTTSLPPDAACIQWGRLRAAVFVLMKSCANPGLSSLAAEAIAAINRAECEAVILQCNAGRESSSAIFHDSVVGEDVLPAGAFVMLLSEVLNGVFAVANAKHLRDQQILDLSQGCILALCDSMRPVFAALATQSPEAEGHIDPRPTLAEAWYLSMVSLAFLFKAMPHVLFRNDATKQLVIETFVMSIESLLSRGIEGRGRKATYAVCMSLDGPQTFALLKFMETAFSYGPDILELTHHHLQKKFLFEAPELSQRRSLELAPALVGGASIAAALLRGSSGVLPPWAVEDYPSLLSSFYGACGRNCDFFCQVLSLACELQLANAHGGCLGELQTGDKLAGRFFENMSQSAKNTLVSQSRATCERDDEASWRRLKVVVKHACGGKKKASGFNQKPSATGWACERV